MKRHLTWYTLCKMQSMLTIYLEISREYSVADIMSSHPTRYTASEMQSKLLVYFDT